jgi:cyclophilin family peptidyl-prolyl cis-trans isomerase
MTLGEAPHSQGHTVKRLLVLLVGVTLLAVSACEHKSAGPTANVTTQAKPSNPANPVVVIETSMGTITAELYKDKAPLTVDNFLAYVDDKFYDGTLFHRVIRDFMIQGGGYEPGLKEKKQRAQIKNEAKNGLRNQRGTLAMARLDDPDTAAAEFFINTVDNFRLDYRADPKDPDKVNGYCVFGKVLSGMDVVDQIEQTPTEVRKVDVEINAKVVPIEFEGVPVIDVLIKSTRRAK